MIEQTRSMSRATKIEGVSRTEPVSHIAVIGNALPRRCGLATYTSHVVDALGATFPDLTVDHYAMDDGSGVAYPDGVRTIDAADPHAYRETAGLIETSGAQAIWVQHEFGIFGGEAGSHLMLLLERTTLPVIVTLHTVLENPSVAERAVFERLLGRASKIIVMADRGRRILRDVYDLAEDRIALIEHGVPDRTPVAADAAKARFDLAGKKVVMTFGLLAPDKGLDHMIQALPALVADHPDCTYLVIGATHPNLIREQGEAYRESLIALADRLGVAEHVRFMDAFLEQEELLDWLEACDVYVTPYLNLNQITSGTLSYAVALGKPVVSTPYIHATEILADDHGVIVAPRSSEALADAVGRLLSDAEERAAISARAYSRGRDFIWSRNAERSLATIEQAQGPKVRPFGAIVPPSLKPLAPSLDAVTRMTDSTGMLQHGIYSVPDRNHGYCLDDNARGLILACSVEDSDETELARLSSIYAAFIQHAWNPDRNCFRNFMHFDRRWCEEEGSPDSNGRGLWALGYTVAHGRDRAMRDWALHLFDHACGLVDNLKAPRALGFAALGAEKILSVIPGHGNARAILETSAELLETLANRERRPDWTWFEPVLAYDNARLPEVLIRAGKALDRPNWLGTGLATLDWLVGVQSNPAGAFRAVGTDSFGRPYAPPLPFDQQPLEAQATIDACLAAHAATGDDRWIDEALRAYAWFTGSNDLGQPLAGRLDGGCFDGLMPHGVNRNQGAESILALQLANVAIASISGAAKTASERDAA